MFTKVSHSGNPVKIFSLGGCFAQNLVILAKSEPSGSLLDIENAAQAHSVSPRGFFGKNVVQSASQAFETAELGFLGSNFKVSEESETYDPCRHFF